MNTTAKVETSKIWNILSEIPDPEIPVISITELGVVRQVALENGQTIITITPTYTGCPAMNHFVKDIKTVLRINGYTNVVIKTVYAPAWTTDWLSEDAKEKLRQYGIAPPVKNSANKDDLFAPSPVVPCPQCGSKSTVLKSQFGSTACKALYSCTDCLEPFEYFKCL